MTGSDVLKVLGYQPGFCQFEPLDGWSAAHNGWQNNEERQCKGVHDCGLSAAETCS